MPAKNQKTKGPYKKLRAFTIENSLYNTSLNKFLAKLRKTQFFEKFDFIHQHSFLQA